MAGVYGFCAFELPVNERFYREKRYFKAYYEPIGENEAHFMGVEHHAVVLREFVGFALTFAATVAVGMNTGNWLLAGGAHLLSRFILNGIVHTEMNLTLKKPSS